MTEIIKNGASTVFWYMVLTPLRIVRNILIGVGLMILAIVLFGTSATVALTIAMTLLNWGGTANWMWVLFCAMVGFVSFAGTMTALTQGGKVIRKTVRGGAMNKTVKV
jgi:hypothetical protein